jgi:hypothetical protein
VCYWHKLVEMRRMELRGLSGGSMER